MQLRKNIVLLLLVCLVATAVRAQVIVGADGPDEPIKIDYSSPKTYEIGGITSRITTLQLTLRQKPVELRSL